MIFNTHTHIYMYNYIVTINFTEIITILKIIKHQFREKHRALVMIPDVILFTSTSSLLTITRPRDTVRYDGFPKATVRLRSIWCLLQCSENWETYYFHWEKKIKRQPCSCLWTSLCTAGINALNIRKRSTRRAFMIQYTKKKKREGEKKCYNMSCSQSANFFFFFEIKPPSVRKKCPIFSTGF